jgi:4-amino-4-deoxy-L-arabinose transferase-like glycosyltransferase
LLRVVSLGLGAVTVLCAYALSHLLWPDRLFQALGAAAFVALNPKFISVSAGVTNDNLLNALFGISLVCALRGVRDGVAWHRWAMLGLLVGLGMLTKQNGLLLLPLGLLAIAWQQGRQGSVLSWRGKTLMDGAAFLGLAFAVGGWWYVRNAILYHDPLGLEPHFAIKEPMAHFGLQELLMIARGYWAAFGWAPILVEPWMYVAAGVVVLVAVAGMVVALGGSLREASPVTKRGLALLGLAFLLNLAALVRWTINTSAPIGRLLFITLPVVGVLIAWGLSQWARWSVVRWGLGLLVGLAFLLAAVIPWRYLRPAYASPRLTSGVPGTANVVGLTFQGGIRLAGYEADDEDLVPGEGVHLTLFWNTLTTLSQRYRTWIQLGPQDPTSRVAEDGYWLGGTLYPADLWQAGDTVRQAFDLPVPDWTPAPGLYWIRIGLVDSDGMRLELMDHSSDMVVLGPWRVRAISTSSAPTCGTDYRLGEMIRLLGYDLVQGQDTGERKLELTLYWQAKQVPLADYSVFVHGVDEDGVLLGQHDGPPRDGAYPTSWWLPGDVILDQHVFSLSGEGAGDDPVRLWVGMYDQATTARLPAYNELGERLPDDMIPLTTGMSQGVGVQCRSD